MNKVEDQLKTIPVFNWFSRYEFLDDNSKPSTHFPKQITTQRTPLEFKAEAKTQAVNELTIQFE